MLAKPTNNSTPELKGDTKAGAHKRESMSILLEKLPEKKTREGFDQRMAARFALELEREVSQQNLKNIISGK